MRFPAGCCRAARPCPRVARRDHGRATAGTTGAAIGLYERPLLAEFIDAAPDTACLQSNVRSGTHRQECLNPTGIRDHPRTFGPKHADPLLGKAPANRLLLVLDLAAASLHRTQEVVGSSPTSSIGEKPCVFRLGWRLNRR
jgi:hypothetical protein